MPRRAAEKSSVIHMVVDAFQAALQALQAKPTTQKIEKLATIVHSMMSCSGRFYHRTAHVFDLFDDAAAQPTVALAALFHDIVYVQIDGVPPLVRPMLETYIEEDSGSLTLKGTADTLVGMVNGVFGFAAGSVLPPFGGQNEYLSCVVAVEMLRDLLSPSQLLGIVIAIEGTIPFRQPDDKGQSWCDRAVQRAAEQNTKLKLGFSQFDLEKLVQDAVVMSNHDVGGFAAEDVRVFIANTWSLLPESSPTLRTPGVFMLQDYRACLIKSEKFLGTLDVHRIFHSYHGTPSSEELAQLQQRAHHNLRITVLLLNLKLITAALLESVCVLTGGLEAPASYFLGDIKFGDRIDHFLPPVSTSTQGSAEYQLVATLLRDGYGGADCVGVSFDLDKSPTAAFVLSHLKEDEVVKYRDLAGEYFDGKRDAGGLFGAMPRPVRAAVCEAMAKVVLLRADKLHELAKKA
eukprot:m.235530 g.235530  ORF g.235530 m.235530 type:complete len:460 (-) comp22482_c0_seq1:713-2092(-)